MSKKAMKLALEALETVWYHVGTFAPTDDAIELYDQARTSLRQALAKQEQGEPVAWIVDYEGDKQLSWYCPKKSPSVPLYTTPQQRKPLSLIELSHIFASIPSVPFEGEWQLELARAIEAAHGIIQNYPEKDKT